MTLLQSELDTAVTYRDAALPVHAEANPRFRGMLQDTGTLNTDLLTMWKDLAEHASEPNPFFEPTMLVPALKHLDPSGKIQLLCVHDRLNANRLIALLPIKLRTTYHGLPLRTAEPWKHIHAFLTTPLIRAGFETDALRAMLVALKQRNVAILRLQHSAADGPIATALGKLTDDTGLAAKTTRTWQRAILKSELDGEDYIAQSISKKKRKEYGRVARRLADAGDVVFETADMSDPAAVEGVVLEFLELELAGWKGRAGTAIAQRPAEARFFLDACRAAASAGMLHPLTLRVDGAVAATIINFAGHGAEADGLFSFKITYDETFARYSPGVLLELELTARALGQNNLAFTDSCANPDHPMIDHLWRERREMHDINVATSPSLPHFALSLTRMTERLKMQAKLHIRAALNALKRNLS